MANRTPTRSRQVFCLLTPADIEAVDTDAPWLLWPATTARIALPMRATRRLDLFERVVLELCVATVLNMRRVDEAAAALHLDRQLILFVMQQLQRNGMVDRDYKATPRGIRACDEALVHDSEMRQGSIYQAPWSGRVWPRLILTHPMTVETKWRGGHRARLTLGSAGRPIRADATAVEGSWPEGTILERDVRDAMEQRSIADVLGGDDGGLTVDVSQIDRLSLTSRGDPILLAAPLWAVDGDGVPGVTDPVTGEPSDELWQLLQELAASDAQLKDLLAARGAHASRQSAPLPVVTVDTALAERRVRERVGDWIAHGPLWARCVEVERALLAVELSHDGDRPERIRSVLTETQAVVEELFQHLLRVFPCPDAAAGVQPVMRGDKDGTRRNREHIEAMGRRFGAAVPFNVAIQPRHDLDRALTKQTVSLRGLVAAAVLAAAHVPGHPLQDALSRENTLLKTIDELAELRNKGAHASGVPLTRGDAARAVASAHRVLQLIRLPGVPVLLTN